MKLLTIGTFDTPHMGHAAFLRRCEEFAEEVMVGVNTDEFVLRYKGVAPIYDYDERASMVESLGYDTYPNNSAGRELILELMPDVLAIGSDWARKDYYAQIAVDQDLLDTLDISMLYVPYTHGISSTQLKERLS